MEFKEVLSKRRSIRAYKSEMVSEEIIKSLINEAVLAPSAMNSQPWAFGVITGVEKLRELSTQVKKFLVDSMDKFPLLAKYEETLKNPDYNVFYDAPALIVICSKKVGPSPDADCCLAAENLMLSAVDKGLGTCWIGFAFGYLNTREAKSKLGIPDDYQVIAPLIVGYPNENPESRDREEPEKLFWE